MNSLLVILGPPRSFTTVVSAMLGQHPQMYGLPEMHLFGARNDGRMVAACAEATFNVDHGLMRVVGAVVFRRSNRGTTSRRAAGWLQRRAHFTTGMVIEELAECVRPRILVDKSPSIVYRIETYASAFAMFPSAPDPFTCCGTRGRTASRS